MYYIRLTTPEQVCKLFNDNESLGRVTHACNIVYDGTSYIVFYPAPFHDIVKKWKH